MEPTKGKNRPRILFIFMIAISVIVIGKLVHVHFFDKLTELKSEKVQPKIIKGKGQRGNILACDEKALAISSAEFDLRIDFKNTKVDPDLFYDNIDSLALCLSNFFGDKSISVYKRDITKAYKSNSGYYRLGNRNVNQAEFLTIKNFPYLRKNRFKTGFTPQRSNTRIYPLGFNLSRTIGRLSRAVTNEDDLPLGHYGLEEACESELSGKAGTYLLTQIPRRKIKQTIIEPKDGSDIVTTLDVQFQDFAEEALGRKVLEVKADWGTAIIMDVKTGDIKAIANLEIEKGKLVEGRNNYAVGNIGAMEPGSTFKTASMLVALETNIIDTNSVIETGNGIWEYRRGSIIRDSNWKYGGSGKITVKEVLEKSSNVGTAKIINQLYKQNQEEYVDRINDLLFNQPIDLQIKGMAKPFIPHPTNNPQRWSKTSMAWMSYGYGFEISPLHTLAFYAAIANEGQMMAPRLIKEIITSDGERQELPPRIRVPKICSSQTVRKLHEMLVGVMERGTGKALKSDRYSIAGKTGTTQIFEKNEGYLKNKHNASFVGYFPADSPRYAIMVLIKNPKSAGHYGGIVAGPVFREIADLIYAKDQDIQEWEWANNTKNTQFLPKQINRGTWQDLSNIYSELDIDLETASKESWVASTTKEDHIEFTDSKHIEGTMPNVIGMGVSDALFLLENNGWNVKLRGTGRIKEQHPKKGTKIKRGAKVYLRLG